MQAVVPTLLSKRIFYRVVLLLTLFVVFGCGDRAATRDSKERKAGEGIPLSQRKPVENNSIESMKILDLESAKKISAIDNQNPDHEWVDGKLVSAKDLLEKPLEYETALRCFIHLKNLSLSKDLVINAVAWGRRQIDLNETRLEALIFSKGVPNNGAYFRLTCAKKEERPTLAEVKESLKTIIEIQETKKP